MRSRLALMAGMIAMLAAMTATAQSVPELINYQGKLNDSGGQPVNNASMPMVFSLWDKDVTAENVMNEQVLMGGTAAHALAHQDLTPGSDMVTGLGGAPVYQTPRDYTIDYANGTITRVDAFAGGFIPDGATVEVDYDWTSHGTQLWSEGQAVEVVNGLYQVRLGAVNPITAPVFFGGSAYLEVVVDGSTLSPRQELTSVPFALRAAEADDSALLDGLDSLDFSLAGHTHDFSELTGSVSDAQVPDNITISLADNSSQLNGLPSDAFVLVAGDTMTGHLQVNGPLSTGQDLNVTGDATIMSGNIGLGTPAMNFYGIINSPSTGVDDGAFLYGNNTGVTGSWAGSPNDHFGYLGGSLIGVFGMSGDTTETGSMRGGEFRAYSQTLATGVRAYGFGYSGGTGVGVEGIAQSDSSSAYGGKFSTMGQGDWPHYGVYGYGYTTAVSGSAFGVNGTANNEGTGPAYGGYFGTTALGTGTHYGIFADSQDYAAWLQGGRVHVGNLGTENYVTGDGDLYVENVLEADGNAYVGGDATISGGHVGLGTSPSSSYSVFNDSATAPSYGAYLYGSSYGIVGRLASDPSDHYGFLGSLSQGVHGQSGNSDETSARYGGYFQSETQGISYGSYGVAYGYSASDTMGARGYGYNSHAGDVYGGYFEAYAAGTGTHYGVYAKSDKFGVYATSNDVPIYAAWASDPADHYAMVGTGYYGIYAKAGNSDETDFRYGGSFKALSQGTVIGVDGYAAGYANSNVTGVSGYGYNSGSGSVFGGYFSTASTGTGTHYGVYTYSNGYGIYNASGTKNWVNPDPEDPDKAVAYVTVESGENLTYCRGIATLVNGKATVVLPDHFRKVTSPDYPVTVQLTPRYGHTYGLAVVKSGNSEFEVEELMDGTGNFDFDYTVQGVRLGYEDYQPIIDNVDYVPFQGNQSGMDESEMTTQEFYDHQSAGLKRIFKQNGTLDKDGKVNEAMFKQKGWKMNKEKKPRPGRP